MLASVRGLLAGGLAALAAVSCGGSEPAPAASAPRTDAKRVDSATAGRIAGIVRFDGAAPPNAPIRMAADPVCARENAAGATSETILVASGGLENVFVYLKDGLDAYAFDAPARAVTLDQKGCRYAPHVLGVRVGQPLEIVNSDPTFHNIHAMPDVNREFNVGQPNQGMKSATTFTAREVMVPIKCDVHSWMHAYAGVLEHPYFAVTANGGAFELPNVPPGTYTIEAWHEKLGTQTQTVTIAPKESRDVGFTFTAAGTRP